MSDSRLQPPSGAERQPQARQISSVRYGKSPRLTALSANDLRVLPKPKSVEPSRDIVRHRQSLRAFCHVDAGNRLRRYPPHPEHYE